MAKAIIVDLDRTVYDPVTDSLYEGVSEALEKFRGLGYNLIMVGRANTEQLLLVDKLELRQAVSEVLLNGEQTREVFRGILHRYRAKAPSSYIIGGRTKVEIAIGNDLHTRTIWFRNGKHPVAPPETAREIPDFATSSWQEVAKFIKD